MEAGGPLGPLAGTLVTTEDSGAPVALILPGSGPTDRDGNSPLGIKAAPYRLLAEALAERGVASLRFDKRGMFGSVGAVADANDVTIADYVTDVASWVEVIRAQTDTECVWLIGHSEGGLVAIAAAQSVAHLCGVVLLATPGRKPGDLLREQLRNNASNQPHLAELLAAIDTLEKGGSVQSNGADPVVTMLFPPQVQGFLRDLFRHDPAELIETVRLPILVIQGGKDLQVKTVDADRLMQANPGVKRVDLPAMNHVLKDVPADDPATNLSSYGDASLPLSEGLVEAVADFLRTPR